MSNSITAAKESGKVNPALLNNEVVVHLLFFGKSKSKKAWIGLADSSSFLKDDKGAFIEVTESKAWEMRADYLEKFPTVTVAENKAKNQLEFMQEEDRIRGLCTDFVKNFTAVEYQNCYDDRKVYVAVLRDLQTAIAISDYDSVCAIMTENDESFLQHLRLSRTFEGDFKTISHILADFNIECRRIKKELT